MEENRKLYITRKWVLFILAYYTLLFFLGIYNSYNVLMVADYSPDKSSLSIVGSMSMAISASSIYYIRKLYKLCFVCDLSYEYSTEISFKKMGTIFYFLTRPFYAIIFSLLVVIGIKSGMISAVKKIEFDSGFVYITMFLSFYVGFLSGNFIKILEEKGKKQLEKFFR
ncbi:hypothetical protein [Desulfuromonas acetoxidans]|uniref:hypothetical protein n=1 Tax=Desulfuromonas acetoxidans TaxID=891 RepID=UPI00292FEC08|nr:hypothetical protein [Desulfuromonas acetoxidans]